MKPDGGAENALLSSANESYGTPVAYIELARYVLGKLDCDPASDAYWNHYTVKAGTFYDERIDGMKAPWFGNVIHNAPSNAEKGMRIKPWWARLVDHYVRAEVEAAIWIGFQLGQLCVLQSEPIHPLQLVNLFPRERMNFLVRPKEGGPPQSAGQPTHANYITLLPTRSSPDAARAMLGRFAEMGRHLEIGGAIVRPV